MNPVTSLLAPGVPIAAGVCAMICAAPAAAQYSPYGPSYDSYGYPYSGAYGGNVQTGVNRCAEAVQARLDGYGYGYAGFPGYGGRVLSISRVYRSGYNGGITVRGVASSGRYAYAPYASRSDVDLDWRCTIDYRGVVIALSIVPAQRASGYDHAPPAYDDDVSRYGYVRY